MKNRRLLFTDKKESQKGIFSTALGVIGIVSVIVAVRSTFLNEGQALVRDGMAVLFALLFSVAGIVFGILARLEKNTFHLFSNLGIVLNALLFLAICAMVYLGLAG